MDYVTYEKDTGSLTGGYSQDLQPEHADCYIQVTEDQRSSWVLYRANAARDGVELIPAAPPAPPPVPPQVPMLAFRLAVHEAGLYAAWEGAVGGLADAAAYIRWSFSLTVRRDDAWMLATADALGKTAAEIDALFIAAGAIVV